MYLSKLIATGSYLPRRCLTNEDMKAYVDTSDDWIFNRTGIRSRHIAAEGEYTSDLAAKAAREALKKASLEAQDIDLILVATTTPDYTFPSTAVIVQQKIGASCPAFDLQAVCAGFIYGLVTAEAFIKSGLYKTVLLIGAETFSRLLDWKDRRTCVLFGDGAGAVILTAQSADTPRPSGILAGTLAADGAFCDILRTTDGPSRSAKTGVVIMEGQALFKQAVKLLGAVLHETLQKAAMTADDLDWLVPHQANIRIIQATAKHLNLPMARVITTIESHANTSSASIPLALDSAAGRFKKGDLLALEAIGGGLSWGCVLLRW